jgi:hypothetical protein
VIYHVDTEMSVKKWWYYQTYKTKLGSAITYYRRYTSVFTWFTNEDDDGNKAKNTPVKWCFKIRNKTKFCFY